MRWMLLFSFAAIVVVAVWRDAPQLSARTTLPDNHRNAQAARSVELISDVRVDDRIEPELASPLEDELTEPEDESGSVGRGEFLSLYQHFSLSEVEAEKQQLDRHLAELSVEPLTALFDKGAYQIVATGNQVEVKSGGEVRVEGYRFSPEGEVLHAVLSEVEYPELYEMRRQSRWLGEKTKELRTETARSILAARSH